ncbi:hypothetical protein AB0F73_24960 [Micromonospora purpureochromogenes]|uniref:hypothetical protein n=1 Tax=Micromonospora purpureochromogenes TaxID=47872 RepID=UPI0033F33847
MVALRIRDVSEEVRDALAAHAKGRGQSLQAYLLELVETQARRLRDTSLINHVGGRSCGSRSLPGGSAAELADQREQHGP